MTKPIFSSLAVAAGLVVATAGYAAETSFYAERVAPILDQHCVVCHGPEKVKGKLRVDSFAHLLKGGSDGVVVKAGDAKGSELFRRITLPRDDEEVMPSDGKPLLSANEVKVLELWIAGGASETAPSSEFPGAPALKKKAAVVALTADWRPRSAEIAKLEKAAGVRLVPRSQVATDGLLLRTASAPSRCDDAALAKLAPLKDFIVEAELARTKVTDAGLKELGTWTNLREVDLTKTGITSAGVAALVPLKKLEVVNLTNTAVDAAGVAALKQAPALKQVWLFGTKAQPEPKPEKVVNK